jgi:hypothetical protein
MVKTYNLKNNNNNVTKCTRRDYLCRLSIYTHEHFKQQNKIYMYQLKNGYKRVKLNVIIWSRAASNKCNIHAQEVQLKVCIRIYWITYTVEIWNTTQITLPFTLFKLFLWKEHFNSDGQQLHHYQQIEQTPLI